MNYPNYEYRLKRICTVFEDIVDSEEYYNSTVHSSDIYLIEDTESYLIYEDMVAEYDYWAVLIIDDELFLSATLSELGVTLTSFTSNEILYSKYFSMGNFYALDSHDIFDLITEDLYV